LGPGGDTDNMGALNSIPLCARTREVGIADNEADRNNNVASEVDNNHVPQAVVVQPEATSTPKIGGERRRIEPLPEERDLGDSSNSDSLESDLEARAVSDRTFGSDSGLEQSGDELEITREVEVAEDDRESMDELNIAVDNDSEAETPASLETGDLGVDRATTFRVPANEVDLDDLDKEVDAEFDTIREQPPPCESSESENEDDDPISRKLEDLETTQAITNMLSDLAVGAETRGTALER